MGKNWLIRTKSNHILGPISKEKVLELYQNGSIKTDDEVCSGNGYWFFIRETDLVDKYLKGHNSQSFNPVSEAKDVLTSTTSHTENQGTRDDITLVGALDLKALRESEAPAPTPKAQPQPQASAAAAAPQKKKLKSDTLVKPSENSKKHPKQDWVRFLGIFIFLLLFLIIYFRKNILKTFFDKEASSFFISKVYAQDESPVKKKRILDSEVLIDDLTFKPQLGLDGLRVVSSFQIEKLSCEKINSPVFQLGIILYPQELINEKFLISIRDCILKLSESHPVKKWLKAYSSQPKPDAKEQEAIDFLNEILNSQFNLLTDQKIKSKVIALLSEMPDQTNVEKILKSYLYLMIGNITRSDKILKSLIDERPRNFYKGFNSYSSLYHRTTLLHLDKVLKKFSRHPADRLTFYLFTIYVKNFLNKPDLLELVDELDIDKVEGKMSLAYTERIAHDLVNTTRLARMDDERRMKKLRTSDLSLEMQSYWVWPFIDVDPLISETTVKQVKGLDQSDPLWAFYLLDNEKLADLYFKDGGVPISRRRSFLREQLSSQEDFMLTLYKLIEIGDIDEGLVQKVSLFMRDE